MSGQVIMSKQNGELAIAVPLYPNLAPDALTEVDGLILAVTDMKPLAYIVSVGKDDNGTLVNAKIVETQCKFLGDL